MPTLLKLLLTDSKGIKNWFGSQTISKLFVAVLFLAIFSGVFWVLYLGSRFFFMTLAPLGSYGFLTADYILRAAAITIFWLGLGSSIVANLNILFGGNRNLAHLLTLPVKVADLVWWLFVKSVITNIALLAIFLLPLLLALGSAFWGGLSGLYIFQVSTVIIASALVINSLGALFALLISNWSVKSKIISAVSGVFIFLALLMLLTRFVFPSKLIHLYLADHDQFFQIYKTLPLASNLIPSNWLTSVVTSPSSANITGSLLLVFLSLAGWAFLSRKYFLTSWQESSSRSQVPQTAAQVSASNWIGVDPLLLKERLSLLRRPGELGYGFFLLTILALFFGLFSRMKIMEELDGVLILKLVIFSYLWLLFFANTYLLRLVFPAMAAEGDSAWYLFTLPLRREFVFQAKLKHAAILLFPLIIFSLTIWWILPFISSDHLLLALSSTWAVFTLTLVHALMGAIHPNFSEGGSSERVSTSFMGLLTLGLSTLSALVYARSIWLHITGSLSLVAVIVVHLLTSLVFLIPLYLAARSSLKRYEF